MSRVSPPAKSPDGLSLPPVAERTGPYDALKEAILQSELPPGQPLIETALASWLNVSRTPIREALNRLEQDGLVVRGDRGLVVRSRSPEEILDIYEARIALEGTVGRMAAERRTEYDLRALRRSVEQPVEDDDDARVEANRQFHRAMWRASHNESLVDLLERVNLHLARYPATTLSFPGRWEEAVMEHASLVDAVESRDSNLAHEISFRHFSEARDIRLKLWDNNSLA
ncbi:MAG: GntR family transcriptional regulator [Acidimicrobiales bacterium]